MRPLSDWQCSLERLDPSRGYETNNVALIALEFNHSRQWSLDKFEKIAGLLNDASKQHITEELISNALEPSHRAYGRRRHAYFEVRDGVDFYYCHDCETFDSLDNFRRCATHSLTVCGRCHMKKTQQIQNHTLRGAIKVMIANAKHRASKKTRSTQTDNKYPERTEFDLTFDHVVDMIRRQLARCYYSGIPLDFRANENWRMSLERLDNSRGYTKDNCVLICWE